MTASIMVWAALIAVLLLIFFYISRPLTNEEVAALASIRRIKGIRAYYSFDNREYTANPSFKKMMNPNGQMYVVNDPLWKFPAIAAALLKGKKHEWIIIGFEKNKRIHKMWTNKGYNNSSVDILFSPEQLVDIAKEDDYCSVLIFHNHPNSNPNRYDCSMASNQDISTARKFANTLNTNGINLLEFICERGQHYEYYLSAANSFMPIESYLKDIRENNGTSRFNNLGLQIELTFGKQQKTALYAGTKNYDNKNIGNESTVTAILYGILALLLFLYPQSLVIIVPIFILMILGKNS
jgi:hypothetical protein